MLVNNTHYIQVSNYTDLRHLTSHFKLHEQFSKEIARGGRELVHSLTYRYSVENYSIH